MADRKPELAKLSRPRLPGSIPRERLFAKLDAAEDKRVIWIYGPPGAGKTVLASSYVDARARPTLWYQVDAGDVDPATVFYYLSEAASALRRGKRARLPLLTPEYLADFPGFTRRFFRRLFERLPASGLLVLDNFQDAGDHPSFADLIRAAVEEVPAHAQIVVLSRSAPGESFARARVSQSLFELDWSDLRLSAEEALLLAGLERPIDRQAVLQLHTLADGWAAGFVLLLEHTRRVGVAASVLSTDSPQVLFDYFASEIFTNLSERVRQMLMRVAFLPRFGAAMAADLSDEADAPQLLDMLHRRGLFVDRRAGAGLAYQFHPLLRDFLLANAKRSLPGSERSKIAARAALLMEKAGEIDAAATLYGEAGEWPQLIRLVCDNAGSFLAQGRNQALDALINLLPAAVVEHAPWMLYWRAMAKLPFEPPASRELLQAAHAMFKATEDVRGQFLSCAAVLDTHFFGLDGFKGEDAWISVMEDLLARHPNFHTPDVELQVLAAGRALIFRAPLHPMVADWAGRVRALIDGPMGPHVLALLGNFLFLFELWQGNHTAVEELVREGRRLFDPRRTPPVVLLSLEIWDIHSGLLQADHARSHASTERALEIGRNHGIHVFEHLVLGVGTYAALSEGDLDKARDHLHRMETSPYPLSALDRGFIPHLRACLNLLRGDVAAARTVGELAWAMAQELGAPFIVALNHAAMAQVQSEQGDFAAARAHVSPLRAFAEALPALSFAFLALLIEADMLMREGDETQAIATLAQAMALGREHDYLYTVPFWVPKTMARLCAIALERSIETDYVMRLVRKRRLAPPSIDVERWPWDVRLYTLGHFSIQIDGVALGSEGRAPRKTLELLQALIALGGCDVDVAMLAQSLWPDAEGDAAHHALETGVHRLRKLVGREIVLLHGGRIGLDPQRCWVDAWALERALGRLKALLDEGADPDRIRPPLARVLALYKGSFLGQSAQPWLLATRERLRARVLRSIDAAAECFERAGDWNAALDLLHQGVDLDPFAEAFYRRLMLAYQRLDRPAEALATWRRCQRTLSAGLGIAPSAETETIARQLRT